MTRLKWYRIRVTGAPGAFLRRIKATKFSVDANSGFLPAFEGATGANNLRFLWRSSVVAMSFDEAGNRTSQTFNSIEQITLNLYPSSDFLWMRITDPPRGTRELFSALERVGGMGMSIEPEVFTPKQQAQMLKRCDDYRLVGLRGVGTSTEHRVVARIELASKEGIEPERLLFLDQLQFAADHSSYEIVEQGLKGQVTFTATGAVRITGGILPFILSQLEAQLGIGE